MKRTIFLLGVIAFFGGSLLSQSFVFFHHEEELENNAVVEITKLDPEYLEIGMYYFESGIEIKNTKEETISAKMTQKILEYPTNPGELEFCFGMCYNGNKDAESNYDVPSGFLSGFHLSFGRMEEGKYTSIKVQYDVFPISNPEDKTTITIIYDYSESGISKLNQYENISVFNQNGKVCFDFNQIRSGMQLVIYNITGTEIGHYDIDSKLFMLPETLKKGIYIYAIKEKGKVNHSGKYVQK